MVIHILSSVHAMILPPIITWWRRYKIINDDYSFVFPSSLLCVCVSCLLLTFLWGSNWRLSVLVLLSVWFNLPLDFCASCLFFLHHYSSRFASLSASLFFSLTLYFRFKASPYRYYHAPLGDRVKLYLLLFVFRVVRLVYRHRNSLLWLRNRMWW